MASLLCVRGALFVSLALLAASCLADKKASESSSQENDGRDVETIIKKKYMNYFPDNQPFMINKDQLKLCKRMVEMLNAIETPMHCRMKYHADFPEFSSPKWIEIKEETKWQPQLKKQSWEQVKRVMPRDKFDAHFKKKMEKFSSNPAWNGGFLELTIDIDSDGWKELIVSYDTDCEQTNKARGRDGVTTSMSSSSDVSIVLNENKAYDERYDGISGWHIFLYDNTPYLIKWSGGDIVNLEIASVSYSGEPKTAKRIGVPFCFIKNIE